MPGYEDNPDKTLFILHLHLLFYRGQWARHLCYSTQFLVAKAEQNKPRLTVTEKKPTGLVNIIEDKEAFVMHGVVHRLISFANTRRYSRNKL